MKSLQDPSIVSVGWSFIIGNNWFGWIHDPLTCRIDAIDDEELPGGTNSKQS